MAGILLGHNATTGVSTYYHNNPDEIGGMAIERRQDLTEFHESQAREVQASEGERFGEVRRVGRIPSIYLADLLRDGKLFDEKYMMGWFKDHPECFSFHNRNW